MDATQRRIVYGIVVALVCGIVLIWLFAANLGGLVMLLPTLPAAPAVIYAWILQRRVYRQDLRDLNSRPDWLP